MRRLFLRIKHQSGHLRKVTLAGWWVGSEMGCQFHPPFIQWRYSTARDMNHFLIFSSFLNSSDYYTDLIYILFILFSANLQGLRVETGSREKWEVSPRKGTKSLGHQWVRNLSSHVDILELPQHIFTIFHIFTSTLSAIITQLLIL